MSGNQYFRELGIYTHTKTFYVLVVVFLMLSLTLMSAGADVMVTAWVAEVIGSTLVMAYVRISWREHKRAGAMDRKRQMELAKAKAVYQHNTLKDTAQYTAALAERVASASTQSFGRKIDQNLHAEYGRQTEKLPVVTNRLPVVVDAYQESATSKLPVPYQQDGTVVAWATSDRKNYLAPKLNAVIGKAILGTGIRGSGKTNTAAVFLEQVFKEIYGPIPGVVFDPENDYSSLYALLPNYCRVGGAPDWKDAWRHDGHYWQVTEENARYVGYEVLEKGVQLILEVGSYLTEEGTPDFDMAARIMVNIISGLFEWADERDPGERVPALVVLDEAQQYLPQNPGNAGISKEESQKLMNAFARVNSVGRKRGLTPVIFTQRIAEINKRVISGSEIYIFQQQVMKQDLDVVMQYLSEHGVTREQVSGLKKGEGWVYVPVNNPPAFKVTFDLRKSVHRGITPGAQHAAKRYHGRAVPNGNLSANFTGDDIEDEEIYEEQEGRDTDPEENDLYYTPPVQQREQVAPQRVQQQSELDKVVMLRREKLSQRDIGDKLDFGKDKVGYLLRQAVKEKLLTPEEAGIRV